ncbi:MAG: hypothetical protein WC027_02105 [Candidatus Paceibacterota bacterium]
MILSVHATFGAAVASLMPTHPVAGFALGFASHLALDMIPHRDYNLLSLESDPTKKIRLAQDLSRKLKLARDMALVSLDALVGFCLAFLLFFDPAYPFIFFLGAFGSMLPDFFTFLYLILKHHSLSLFFKFHIGLHSKKVLALNQVAGVFLQFVTVIILILVLFSLVAVVPF